MRKTQSKKLTCLVLSFLMLLSVLPMTVYAAGEEEEAPAQSGRTTLQEISETLISFSYADYVEQPEYQSASRGKQTVVIKAIDYDAAATTAEVEIVNDYNVSAATGDAGKGKSLKMSDDGKVVWKVNIPETGLYAIKMDYCSVTDKTNSIERGFYINDALPFAEARDLTMKKIWVNAYTKNEETGEERFEVDSNGNELRPVSSVVHEWQEYVFIDPNTFFADPFEFYFEKGENTIALNAVREAVVIQNITIYPYEDLPSYEAYAAGKSPANTSDKYHVVAETPYRTSDFTVYPIYDRKSAISEPQDSSKIMLNTIGSEKWQTAGQEAHRRNGVAHVAERRHRTGRDEPLKEPPPRHANVKYLAFHCRHYSKFTDVNPARTATFPAARRDSCRSRGPCRCRGRSHGLWRGSRCRSRTRPTADTCRRQSPRARAPDT